MLTGLDTGFFFALQEKQPLALSVWMERETITSVIVLYELQKKFLKGEFNEWPTIISDICEAVDVVPVNRETALRASHIGYGTGIPGLDALILSIQIPKGFFSFRFMLFPRNLDVGYPFAIVPGYSRYIVQYEDSHPDCESHGHGTISATARTPNVL